MYTIKQTFAGRITYTVLLLFVLAVVIVSTVFLLRPPSTNQVSLVLLSTSPAQIEVTEGIFTLSAEIDSSVPVNMFSVDLQFDPTLVTVESVDYESSIADVWVFEPTYDNASGTISAAGGTTLAGGFTGNGTLFTVVFKTHKSGVTTVGLTQATVLRSNGEGTAAELGELNNTIVTIAQQSAVNTEPLGYTKPITSIGAVSSLAIDEWDLNNDGLRTFSDAGVLIQLLYTNSAKADFDHDGLVTNKDLEILLKHL